MSGDDSDEELGQVAEQINGIANRFGSDETSDTSDTTETSETIETSEAVGTTETSDTTEGLAPGDDGFRIRDNWNGRTIYLPDDAVDELDLRYQQMNLRWMEEHGEELPKNERFYPAVIRSALHNTSIESELGLD